MGCPLSIVKVYISTNLNIPSPPHTTSPPNNFLGFSFQGMQTITEHERHSENLYARYPTTHSICLVYYSTYTYALNIDHQIYIYINIKNHIYFRYEILTSCWILDSPSFSRGPSKLSVQKSPIHLWSKGRLWLFLRRQDLGLASKNHHRGRGPLQCGAPVPELSWCK